MNSLIVLPLAYLLGAIPFGYLLVRWKTGSDVRSKGSGNIGATNVLRTTGPVAGVITLLLDIAKGYLAVWIAGRLTDNSPWWTSAAALAVMAGHAFPVFLRFHGGKAVATFVGAFLRLAPLAMLLSILIFVVVVAWTHHISMGSIIAAAVFPLGVWLLLMPPWPVELASLLGGAFIIYRHSSNIRRLHEGSENVFTFGARN